MSNTRCLRASALLLLTALPACVGSSVSPLLSSSSPTPAASAATSASPSSSSTPVAATWTFGGSSANLAAVAGQTPSPVTLSAYQGITATLQFGQVTSGSGTITLSDALNSGNDVSPNTLPADNATTGATPIAYMSFYNGTSTSISFGSVTPRIQITNTNGFPSGATTCELDVYSNNGGSGLTWNSVGATGTISGNTVTINSVTLTGTTVDFQPGQQVTAIACT